MPEATEEQTWWELTTYGILARAARLWPHREAVVTPRERLTYAQLAAWVHSLAYGLLQAGVGPSDHVATLFGTRSEWIALQYALGCIGAVVVPLNTRLQPEELRYALGRVEATAVVTMDRDGGQEFLPRLEIACPELSGAREGVVESALLPRLRLAACFSPGGQRYANYLDFQRLAWPADEVDHDLLGRTSRAVKPEDVATILFTSGSTGFPKGAMLTHRNLAGQAHHQSRLIRLQPDDRYVNMMPIFHCGGYVSGVLTNHYACDTFCLVDTFDAEEILRVSLEEHITVWLGFPTVINRVLDLAEQQQADLSSIQKAHIPYPKTWDRVLQESGATHMTTLYGLTEGGGIVTMTPLEEKDPAQRRDTHGAPLPGVSVRIVDPETGEEVPRGQPGEITFRGWNRFEGYYGDPERTAATIDDQGYCYTGDRGLMGEDRHLRFLGRYKEMIKTGGENVSQLEVERFLEQRISGVATACVVGVPDPVWDEAVTAVIELEPGSHLSHEEVQAQCRGHIASFKIPKHVLFRPDGGWPLVGSGKVDKTALRSWAMRELGISSQEGQA